MSTEPTAEAVEAVARAIQDEAENSKQFEDAAWIEGFDTDMAKAAIVLIREAIHSDGADADAIREALGLAWEYDGASRRRYLVSVEWQEDQQ